MAYGGLLCLKLYNFGAKLIESLSVVITSTEHKQ